MTTTSSRTRTCIATRTRQDECALLRLVLDPSDPDRSRVLPDPRRRLPGRGAWITPTIEALELALKQRAIARALRASTPVDTGEVREYLENLDPENHKRKT